MSGADLGTAASVFLASAVECVEALTIVLAVGSTRSWRSALGGVGAALLALAVLVAVIGGGLSALPIDVLRVLVGVFLLLFGLQWLRKAVLRESGRKAMRDEDVAYERELEAARAAGAPQRGWDPYSFSIAAKGVLVEGLEVALIVVTIGAPRGRTGIAAAAAGAAALVVIAAGIAARHPLSRVPENTLKFAVGVLLTAYGIFWSGEGAGVHWPGSDAFLIVLVLAVLGASLAAVHLLRRRAAAAAAAGP
ncbi:MAG TPA: hypothetical protein VNV44_00265 [Solirubrobacteraceae bacterium]|jgi:uncharacterized membrane protein|nr:hypothetical protein [Solirubrobacteraceae bacterium]